MTGFLRRHALSRRTFLRGAGCAVALPWLDAMVPALSRAVPPRRCMFVFSPNGKSMDDWRPAEVGSDFALPFLLEPLAPLRERLLVATQLDLDGGFAHGDGPGDQARAAASFLTTAHPFKTDGADIRNGVSVDQVIAQAVGGATRLPSLELGLERGRMSGRCDSGYSCAYTQHIAWSSATTPLAKEHEPRTVFARLFGDPDALIDAEAERAAARRRRSVLDAVAEDARDLARTLGRADAVRFGEYLDSVRAFELRLEQAEQRAAEDVGGVGRGDVEVAVPETLRRRRPSFEDSLALMYEICALALATDATRVITLMLGNAGSGRSYRFLGVPEGHHDLSHHRGDSEKVEKIRRINRWHIEQFARFGERLAGVDVGDGDLLDHSLVLYGSGLADGNRHRHDDLPIVVLGRGGGRWPTGRHVRAEKKTPLGNLYLSMLDSLGVEAETFGDATGRLL